MLSAAIQLVERLDPNEVPGDDPYAIAWVTSLSPLRVAFEGNVDASGNLVETPQALVALSTYSPAVGSRVLLSKVGGTWVIMGSIDSPGDNYSRYHVARTANGVASLAYDQFGTPPTTPWSTGSLTGGAQSMSRTTITKDCHLDLYANLSGEGAIRFIFWSNGTGAHGQSVGEVQQGGGVFEEGLMWSGLALAGELFDLNFRNTFTGALNYTARTWWTFRDAHTVVGQG